MKACRSVAAAVRDAAPHPVAKGARPSLGITSQQVVGIPGSSQHLSTHSFKVILEAHKNFNAHHLSSVWPAVPLSCRHLDH